MGMLDSSLYAEKCVMMIPTKRVIIDAAVLVFVLFALLVIRPQVGDSTPFGGGPHTAISVVLFYVFGVIIAGAALRDLLRATRSGGAFKRGPISLRTLSLTVGHWEWSEPIRLEADEGLMVSAYCSRSPSSVITFMFCLADADTVPGRPQVRTAIRAAEVAWEAETVPSDTLVPAPRPGIYALGVRAEGETPGRVVIRIRLSRTQAPTAAGSNDVGVVVADWGKR